MAGRYNLGPLEARVMAAIQMLGAAAYGMTIHAEVEKFDRRASLGSVYVVLERLGEKGFCDSRFGDPTPVRGGRAKRFFSLTPAGDQALANWKTVTENVLREMV